MSSVNNATSVHGVVSVKSHFKERWMLVIFRAVLLFLMCNVLAPVKANQLIVSVIDFDTQSPIEARIYLQGADGKDYFFETADERGNAVKYEKQNWINAKSLENHTTVSAHPCYCELSPGVYTLMVERGKTYFSHRQRIEIKEPSQEVKVTLRRWCDTERRGWYSGDLHIHREIADLRNVLLAEDLNVAFPLTNWVTKSGTPPIQGDKNLNQSVPENLIMVDENHVIWPRNTEYEIFSVGEKRHTLGALFVLGHSEGLEATVPPWEPVIDQMQSAEDLVLLDMDKLAWPSSMVLPFLAPNATYELANNHLWRTEFAFRQWTTPAPAFIQPPFGGSEGGEREWIDFTLGMYYSLLNCGFQLPPSAGTANGVHPVPAGFSRVYVHLENGFSLEDWKTGLQAGRSFVTTGPMLFGTINGQDPGFSFNLKPEEIYPLDVNLTIHSEGPISYGELIHNGEPVELIRPSNQKIENGSYVSTYQRVLDCDQSGWYAIRVFEEPEAGRVRFAHTAPWYVHKDGSRLLPTHEQKHFLVSRMKDEIQRSRGIVSGEGLEEYSRALRFYESLEVRPPSEGMLTGRPLKRDDRDEWLRNMIIDHQFTDREIQDATGMTLDAVRDLMRRYTSAGELRAQETAELKVLPYPGGRHPRRGFLEGAVDPQRETKVSVFAPWDGGGYAVIDVPEAIFSNLGLTYLAHTHIPTIWTASGTSLEPVEWEKRGKHLMMRRELPNGIIMTSTVSKEQTSVQMQIDLTNGTSEKLTGLRVQVCTMLKGLVGFQTQRRRKQMQEGPLIAVQSDTGNRWLITAWTPLNRCWANPPVPCIHSDPIFPDCDPGETVTVSGGLWFYEGTEIQTELERIRMENNFE